MAENLPVKNDSQILIYQTEGGQTKLEVLLKDETVWLTQKLMAELFQTTIPNVNIHIKNIFEDGELDPDSVIKDFLTTAADGKNYRTKFYSLDIIISVGYRVKSHVATRFRQWATQRLREYIVKGFVLDDERLKNPDQPFDYFDELLRRIQDIRTSERRFYQKITDIYATSIDYDPRFFHKKSSKNCPSGEGWRCASLHTKNDFFTKNQARNALGGWGGDLLNCTMKKNALKAGIMTDKFFDKPVPRHCTPSSRPCTDKIADTKTEDQYND